MRDLVAKLRGKFFILGCRFFRKSIQIGDGLRIYKKICIKGNGNIIIGENCIIDGIVGDNSQYVTLDTHSPDAVIHIGENASLFAARISAKYHIKIGNDVMIEEAGIVDTDFHSIKRDRSTPAHENIDMCKIEIGDRVCIGARSIIMKGLRIEDDVVIGPGSIVTSSIRSGIFVLGNPAKPIRS